MKKLILVGFFSLFSIAALGQSAPFNAYSVQSLGGNCSTQGSILAQGANGASFCLAPGLTSGQFLTTLGAGSNPIWTSPGAISTNIQSGVTPTTTYTAGQFVYSDATHAQAGNFNGTDFSFTAGNLTLAGVVPSKGGLFGATSNAIPFGSGSGAQNFITPAANSVIATNGSNVPSLVTTLPANLTYPTATITNSLTLNAASGQTTSFNQTQTASGGSSTANPFVLNQYHIIDTMLQAGVGLNIFYGIDGSNWQNPKTGFNVEAFMNHDASGSGASNNNDIAAISTSTQSVVPTTRSDIDLFGANFYVSAQAGATGYRAIVGQENDVAISSTASGGERIGFQAIGEIPQGSSGDGGQQASGLDFGFGVGTDVANGSAPWKVGYYSYAGTYNTSSSVMSMDTNSAQYGINLNNLTVTTCAFAYGFNAFCVGPSGNVNLQNLAVNAGGVITIPSVPFQVRNQVNSNLISVSGGGTTSSIEVVNDANTAFEPLQFVADTFTFTFGGMNTQSINAAGNVTAPLHLTNAALPTISACGTGTPVASAGSSSASGQITTGTTVASCSVAFSVPWPNHAYCTVAIVDSGTFFTVPDISSGDNKSGFGVTFSAPAGGPLVFNYVCNGN